jgi:phosphocarrier protein
VKLAGRYKAEIRVAKDGMEVNGKSIMGVLMLAAEQGSSLEIRADGDDAEEAVEALAALVRAGFQEA